MEINIICGLIGAGKTSYAKTIKGKLIDLDLSDCSTKMGQLQLLADVIKYSDIVNYVTCFPTKEELSIFQKLNKKTTVNYIWINTNQSKSLSNIMKRNRKNDIDNFCEWKEKNKYLEESYIKSNIKFKEINTFKNTESW